MKYKDAPFGKVPEVWKIRPISAVTELVTDYVANGSFASLAANVTYKDTEDEAVLIRLADYNNDFKGNFVYKNESLCKKCDIGFYPKNSGKFCGNCTADTRGSDCGVCRYNQNNDKTECFKCYKRHYSSDSYTFVQNTFQCLKNDDENKFDYFKCVDSVYNEET